MDSKTNNPLSLEQKEIVLIFCLFVFVALLMFTVGILVGKGLAQGRLARTPSSPVTVPAVPSEKAERKPTELKGSSVNSQSLHSPDTEKPAKEESQSKNEGTLLAQPEKDIQWIPQKNEQPLNSSHSNLLEPQQVPTEEILRNPNLKSVIEDTSREVASVPPSFASGNFTVQVASYSVQKDAQDRVEALKKLGFSNAYFSVNQMNHTDETWYRVWLGFFPDFRAANHAGRFLKDRGEVKQYLVRKTDNSGKEN